MLTCHTNAPSYEDYGHSPMKINVFLSRSQWNRLTNIAFTHSPGILVGYLEVSDKSYLTDCESNTDTKCYAPWIKETEIED